MIYNYPFFSFPYLRRYPMSPYTYTPRSNFNNMQNKNSLEKSKELHNKNSKVNSDKKNDNSQKPFYGFSFLDNFFNQQDRSDDESYFDLFGLKLYNDDLLLIVLIFFLYKEDVKDQYLFIALILLLLS